ncbi:Co-chaperone protein HscB [Buchnera aphidicola (Cinara cuneomaculata)]|uniref:Co-chaperone protein HscB n=1 Tax=Buchnera aphidicola (Cinara cuneomaculata) TaxID=1660040 RepID=A0A451CYR3_9GAMM|nr:Fe-S protein assembly co-chaperone HscB [Buchnera aphidicola]VFP78418.1 Co-chaperone protein HscB [Buchnera aphidicola (Cinara cuneomaculata)]
MNYFDLFQLSPQFNIDQNKLINKFYELQHKYHPDNYLDKKLNKKNQLLMSIKINQGFNILKNKFTRAQYLLKINKKKINTKKNYISNQNNVLIKQFQLHEKLQKIKNQSNSHIQINNFIKKIKVKLNLYFLQFNNAIQEKKINSANKIFYHISFIYKIIKKAKNLKKI